MRSTCPFASLRWRMNHLPRFARVGDGPMVSSQPRYEAKELSVTDMAEFIEGIPKGELHLHIEGTLEPELKFELAARNGITLPYKTVEEAIAGYNFDSLTSFLVGYYEGMGR